MAERPDALYKKIDAFIRKTGMLEDTDLILAGVSGGADSVFLFYLLLALREKYGYALRVIHLHHGIRGAEADRDAAFVRGLCAKYGVPVDIVRRDIPAEAKRSGRTLEEAGRIARYEEFARLAAELAAESATKTKSQKNGAGTVCEGSAAESQESGTGAVCESSAAKSQKNGAGTVCEGSAAESQESGTGAVCESSAAKSQENGTEDRCRDGSAETVSEGSVKENEGEDNQKREGLCGKRLQVKVALAHHQNDAAETLLFNLARGAGVEGLSSIRPVRDFYIRPLLAVRRDEITGWLTAHGISWCEDSTNQDNDAARNRIRHTVIPALERGVNPAAIRHMAASAELCAEAADFIRAEAAARSEKYISCLPADEEGTEHRKTNATFIERKSSVPDAHEDAEFSRKNLRNDNERKSSVPDAHEDAEYSRKNLRNDTKKIAIRQDVCSEMKIMQDEILRLALREFSGSLTDFHRIHIEALEALFGKTNGARLDLPRGLWADRTADGIIICRKERRDGREGAERDEAEAAFLRPLSDAAEKSTGARKAGEPGKDGTPAGSRASSGAGEAVLFGGFSFSGRIFENQGQDIPEKAYTKWFDYDKISVVPVVIRHRRTGDFLVVNDSGGRKSLSDYLTNEKVPQEKRAELTLLMDGSEIIWAVGMRIGYRYRVTAKTRRILEVQAVRES